MTRQIRTGTFMDRPCVEIDGKVYEANLEICALLKAVSEERDDLQQKLNVAQKTLQSIAQEIIMLPATINKATGGVAKVRLQGLVAKTLEKINDE